MQRPLTPSFKVVTEIARHAGSGMTVARFQSLRFPTGACQVWEFKPAWPPLDRPPVVVAVFLRQGRPETWTPVAEPGFDAAVRHYTDLAAAHAAPPAPIPLTLGSPPVAVTAPGGAP